MTYITIVLQFLESYDFIILPVIAALLIVFAIVNFAKNVYRKQNRKIIACTDKIASYPHKASQYAANLPAEYKRQWRAYVNSGAEKPSQTFEFVTVRSKIRFVRTLIFTALCSSLYIVAFVFNTTRRDYLVFQLVFWLAFALILVINKVLSVKNERKAKRIFARLVNELNRAIIVPQSAVEQVDKTVAELKKITKRDVNDVALNRASELLHSKGLSSNRSVEQQRKLNNALNGLLQSYSKANRPTV